MPKDLLTKKTIHYFLIFNKRCITFAKMFFISLMELKLEDINPSKFGGLQGSDTF